MKSQLDSKYKMHAKYELVNPMLIQYEYKISIKWHTL